MPVSRYRSLASSDRNNPLAPLDGLGSALAGLCLWILRCVSVGLEQQLR